MLTRVRLRHWWLMLPCIVMFRRFQGQHIDGLEHAAFAVESPWVFFTVTVWQHERAMLHFGNHRGHSQTVRWTFRQAREIWSAKWDLAEASVHDSWNGRDFARPLVGSIHEP